MGIKELWLRDASVGAFAVPPAGSITVENGTRSSSDCNACAGDGYKRAGPLGVSKGRSTLKDDLEDTVLASISRVYIEGFK